MKILKISFILSAFMLFSCGGSSGTTEETKEDNAAAMENKADDTADDTSDDMPTEPAQDIVDLAIATDNLSTLVTAVQAAELVETLKGEGPFTVFAPTNAAFDALPDGTLEDLLKPENKDQLTAILTYHVVAGKVMSGDLSDGMTATTVNGKDITISVGEGVQINGIDVVTADIEASNGVVHVVSGVILPPEE
jgi:uncharacterized surface protein with fasciclin (FAS1) repeats